jgi:ATP phosphoribosyltransferase regulatory subunit
MTTELVDSPAALPGSSSARLRALYEAAGARWHELPVLHPADPFLETAGEDIRRRMFVTEGPAGERLALRPDFTIPVCLEHLKSGAGSGRYAYDGLVFRRHDTGAPERLETGYEDIGAADAVAADAATLALAIRCVGEIVAGPLRVRLGDIGLFAALLKSLGLPEPWRRRLRRSFGVSKAVAANLDRLSAPRGPEDKRLDPEIRAAADAHDRGRLVALLADRLASQGHAEEAGRSAEEIADRFLDQRALAEVQIEADVLAALRTFLELQADLAVAPETLRRFAAEHRADFGEALGRFSERAEAIRRLAPPAPIRFEAGFGRPLDYYTGLVFEVRGEAHAVPLAGGGRYDRLMEMLGAGQAVPAVGFTMRLDLVAGGAA